MSPTIDVVEVARIIGVSRRTVFRMMDAGEIPQPIRLSKRTMVWLPEVIENWLKERQAWAQNQKA
jgi:prophage regulatory protein